MATIEIESNTCKSEILAYSRHLPHAGVAVDVLVTPALDPNKPIAEIGVEIAEGRNIEAWGPDHFEELYDYLTNSEENGLAKLKEGWKKLLSGDTQGGDVQIQEALEGVYFLDDATENIVVTCARNKAAMELVREEMVKEENRLGSKRKKVLSKSSTEHINGGKRRLWEKYPAEARLAYLAIQGKTMDS